MEQQFKTIPGFSKYEISADGIIRNIKTKDKLTSDVIRKIRLINDEGERKTVNADEAVKEVVFDPIVETNHETVEKVVAKKEFKKAPASDTIKPLTKSDKVYIEAALKNTDRKEICKLYECSNGFISSVLFDYSTKPNKVALAMKKYEAKGSC